MANFSIFYSRTVEQKIEKKIPYPKKGQAGFVRGLKACDFSTNFFLPKRPWRCESLWRYEKNASDVKTKIFWDQNFKRHVMGKER